MGHGDGEENVINFRNPKYLWRVVHNLHLFYRNGSKVKQEISQTGVHHCRLCPRSDTCSFQLFQLKQCCQIANPGAMSIRRCTSFVVYEWRTNKL